MGQRTQALITLKYGDTKTRASVSLHYQWGYGRYMLMDVMNQGVYLINKSFDQRDCTREELGKNIISRSTGVRNFNYSGSIEPYCETLQEVIDFSDNNNGFAHLEIMFTNDWYTELKQAKLTLYDFQGKQISLNQFCESGAEFADKNFIKGYRLIMASYGIEIIEPKITELCIDKTVKDRLLNWLWSMQTTGVFKGFEENDMDFNRLYDEELAYYLVEWWLTDTYIQELEGDIELIEERERIAEIMARR